MYIQDAPLHKVKGRQKTVFQSSFGFSKMDKNNCPFFKNGLEIQNQKMPTFGFRR